MFYCHVYLLPQKMVATAFFILFTLSKFFAVRIDNNRIVYYNSSLKI